VGFSNFVLLNTLYLERSTSVFTSRRLLIATASFFGTGRLLGYRKFAIWVHWWIVLTPENRQHQSIYRERMRFAFGR